MIHHTPTEIRDILKYTSVEEVWHILCYFNEHGIWPETTPTWLLEVREYWKQCSGIDSASTVIAQLYVWVAETKMQA